MSETYTAPERSTERGIAARLRAKVYAVGGCGACLNACHGWGESACDTPGRSFPRCLSTPGVQFEPDYQKLQGKQS